MTPYQYWQGEPELFDAYIEKHNIEIDYQNRQYHLLGKYFVFAIREAMKSKKGETIYPEKPFELSFNKKKDIVSEQDKIENDMKDLFSQIKRQRG